MGVHSGGAGRRPIGRASLLGAAAATAWLVGAVIAEPAQAFDWGERHPEVAALPPNTEPVEQGSILQRQLSAQAEDQYRRIFALQADANWAAVDRIVREMRDPMLLGHVIADRLLHPTGYQAKFVELTDWLKLYADHPDARLIHASALAIKPAYAKPPRPAVTTTVPAYGESSGHSEFYQPSLRVRGDQAKTASGRLRNQIGGLVQSGSPAAANAVLNRKGSREALGAKAAELAQVEVASGYFYVGDFAKAYALAGAVALQAGAQLPQAHWIAGLAAYQLGKYDDAAKHFGATAGSNRSASWSVAAAAFWAARAHMLGQNFAEVRPWFEKAAERPRTFYGMLARRILGLDLSFRWDGPALAQDHVELLLREDAGKRALALIQIGQLERAEQELRQLMTTNNPSLLAAIFALAEEARLTALLMKAADIASEPGNEQYDNALFPVPRWVPKDGFAVDRALIFAFMRQESAFNTRAKSSAGARGLMQLMPATASYISNSNFTGKSTERLYEPELNISLGQKYLLYLLEHEQVQGDLMMLAAAYNGGPGNLARWLSRSSKNVDPLMFIESIPIRETRTFIERVLTNYWIYQRRFGQPTPSLDALAAGERPIYKGSDAPPAATVARNVRN